MSDSPTTPPGWYPDTTAPGTERYWDGAAWTDHSRPVVGAAAPPAPPAPTPYTNAPAPQVGAPVGAKPDNYLVWTILSTILCCLPIGAVGIYYSTQVDKLWAQGDLAGAQDKARTARNLAIVGAVISVAVLVVWVLVVAVVGEWNVQVN